MWISTINLCWHCKKSFPLIIFLRKLQIRSHFRTLYFLCIVTTFLTKIYLPLSHLKGLKFIILVWNYNYSDIKKKAQNIVRNDKLKILFQISRNGFSKMRQITLQFFTLQRIIATAISTTASKDTTKYSCYQSNYEFCSSWTQ